MIEGVNSKFSVGIIGSGIQGVCISLCLIKKGFKVTLIDRDEPGEVSASYGNAGHFSPYASVPINRPDILTDVPSMLFSSGVLWLEMELHTQNDSMVCKIYKKLQ
jgi:D-amino-acid dehydrogenase